MKSTLELLWQPNYCPCCGAPMNAKMTFTGLCHCGYKSVERKMQDDIGDYRRIPCPDHIVINHE